MTDVERLTLTIEEAAKLLGVGRSLAYEAARRNEFPVPIIRLGRRMVVSKHRLMLLLEGGEPEAE